jgi:hypothetical protein
MPALDCPIMLLSIVLYMLLTARNLDETEELVPFLFQKKILYKKTFCCYFELVFQMCLENCKI